MPEKEIQQVSASCAELYHTGKAALERGELTAAIPDFLLALELEPGFLGCRQALRQAVQKAAQRRSGSLGNFMERIRLMPLLSKAQVLAWFKPLKAISLAEAVLSRDPYNPAAHRVLAGAALRAGLSRTAVLSLESISPKHRGTQMKLARALAQSGDPSAAAIIYGRLLKDNPKDTAVLRALRSQALQPFAAAQTSSGNDNFSLNPAPAPHDRDRQSDEEIIEHYETLVVHCPRNTKVLETLAGAYERKQMFDKALGCYNRALQAAGGREPAVEKQIGEMKLKQIDAALKRLDARAPDYAAKREQLQNRRLECEWSQMNCSAE